MYCCTKKNPKEHRQLNCFSATDVSRIFKLWKVSVLL